MSVRNKFLEYKLLANKYPTVIFDALGITYTERYKYINGPCPVHNGDRADAFSWHIEAGIWKCFSKGCHEKHGIDIYGLICGILDCSKGAALAMLEKLFEGNKIDPKEITQYRENQINKNFTESVKQIVKYDEAVLQNFTYHTYLEGRGYPRELIESYHIGFVGNGYSYMSNRVIVPIRDIDGAIVGFSGRTIFEDWKVRGIPKWCDSKGFVKTNFLFNLDRAKNHIQEADAAILVEGPFDVLRLVQAGIENCVAVLGRKLHNAQIGQLLTTGCNKLFVAFDSDVAGQSGADNANRTASSFFSVEQIKLPVKDAGDATVEQLREIFSAVTT